VCETITEPLVPDDVTELHTKMRAEFVAVRGEMREGFAALDGRMIERFALQDGAMHERFARIDGKIDERFAILRGDMTRDRFEVLRWSFGQRVLCAGGVAQPYVTVAVGSFVGTVGRHGSVGLAAAFER